MNKLFFSGLTILGGLWFFTGCAGSTQEIRPDISKTPVSQSDATIKVSISSDMKPFEKELVDIAKKSEVKYNHYIELLKNVKKKKILPPTRIPKNMGKRLTFCFDGYALLLIQRVVEEAGYTFNIGKLVMQDSPIIHRCYKNTTIADILEDVSSDVGYDVIIDEKNMEVKIRYTDE